MQKLIKITKDWLEGFSFDVKVDAAAPPKLKPNEFRCGNCWNIYEKGWTDEDASKESLEAFGITTGELLCDDCYNEYMYARAQRLQPIQREFLPSANAESAKQPNI